MVSVDEAKSLLLKYSSRLDRSCTKKISNCSGYFTYSDIYSPVDLPPFDQSNVDGYAAAYSNMNSWKIVAEIKAGDAPDIKLQSKEAARIFTGALVPEGTEFIVMQEEAIRNQNRLILYNTEIEKGDFIRKKGSQIIKGELAVPKDTFIRPAVAGFLASLGMESLKVYKKPEISLIITGNELQKPGKNLSSGKVYDSNSYIINAALEQMELKLSETIFINDEKELLYDTVSRQIAGSDVLLISGGVSVGKYDFVNAVLDELKVTKIFYKVSQRPGKPLYFGRTDSAYVFGLPGNPASVFTCFYEYVYPLLRRIRGFADPFLHKKKLTLLNDIHKNFKLGNFLKAKASGRNVESFEGQASFILRSFNEANCFIYLPENIQTVKKGQSVEVHMFPQ